MRNYELMTIIKSTVGDDKAKAVSKEIQDLIAANKGSVTKADFWGKRKFAYEIKRDKEGYYDVIEFDLEPESISKLKNKIKLMESVTRYLITAKS